MRYSARAVAIFRVSCESFGIKAPSVLRVVSEWDRSTLPAMLAGHRWVGAFLHQSAFRTDCAALGFSVNYVS
jgi:hypothetical protein